MRFWIVVPAMDRAPELTETVTRALALDSAQHPVDVLVVDDGSADETPDLLAAIHDARLHVLRRDLPEARQGKADAINAAYRMIRQRASWDGIEGQTIIGVLNADGHGTPGMLAHVAALFSSRAVGAVQCRLRVRDRRKIAGVLQDLESAVAGNASQRLADALGSVELTGHGHFVRLTTLTRLGDEPWSADLGLRLHLAGVGIRYADKAIVSHPAAMGLVRSPLGLRRLHYVRPLVRSPRIRTLALLDHLYTLLAPWSALPVALAVLGLIAYGGVTGPNAIVLLAVVSGPGLAWGVLHRMRFGDEPLRRTLAAGLLYPLLLVATTVAATRALRQKTMPQREIAVAV
ncbi:glycosyltransferase [Actinocrispum sp. NPDC049592]|uniref:glycosyltransferase family 2 protein n=1 Tax=Actinocrispum sp. NPDC049592 TaxID=3154835 RepID=UPI00343EB7C3